MEKEITLHQVLYHKRHSLKAYVVNNCSNQRFTWGHNRWYINYQLMKWAIKNEINVHTSTVKAVSPLLFHFTKQREMEDRWWIQIKLKCLYRKTASFNQGPCDRSALNRNICKWCWESWTKQENWHLSLTPSSKN